MAIRFSKVTINTMTDSVEFLMAGVPGDQRDLDGWKAFDQFKANHNEEETAVAHVTVYTYGGEDIVDATPEEVAYMYQRIQTRPDFLEKRCESYPGDDIVIWLDKE